MKHIQIPLAGLLVSLALLTGCGPASDPAQSSGAPEAQLVDGPPWFATFRVVAGAETGQLVLATNEGQAGEVYVLNTQELTLDAPVENGELINVYYDTVLETYPARFGGVTRVEHTETQRDDRCGLYLQVLEDLWDQNEGLRSGTEQIGLDLSGLTDLSESEKSALIWAFGSAHGSFPVSGTWEELVEEGYIDGEALYWEDGVFFSLTGSAEDTFDAQIWRSGLGAYFYSDCTAQLQEDGSWSYEVGAEAIS